MIYRQLNLKSQRSPFFIDKIDKMRYESSDVVASELVPRDAVPKSNKYLAAASHGLFGNARIPK